MIRYETMKVTGLPTDQELTARLVAGSAHHAWPPMPSRRRPASCPLTPARLLSHAHHGQCHLVAHESEPSLGVE